MVTFSSNDSHETLNKKFGIKPTNDRIEVINRDEYADYQQEVYVCDTCGTVLEYNKIDDSYWCNGTCVRYVQPKDAKKAVAFEIPQPQNSEDNTPLVSCGDTPMIEPRKAEPKGVFVEM